jgi:truncated hemoglobin YjbI
MTSDAPYHRIGADRLREVIDLFVDRVYADTMIGFFFRAFDKERLKKLEFQFAARALGATTIAYEGRPLREAHRRHTISGGQFARRTQILREVLDECAVPADVQAAWLDHVARLRPQITGQADAECEPTAAPGPLVTHIPKKT